MLLLGRVPCSCARAAPPRNVRGALRGARSFPYSPSFQQQLTPRAVTTASYAPPVSARCYGSTVDSFLLREIQPQRPVVPPSWSLVVGHCYESSSRTRTRTASWPQQQQRRGYVSRAHPAVAQPLGLHTALRHVLDDAEHRAERRKRKAIRNSKADSAAAVDETVELAINLNLDPRKPNQALRGSVELPSGSGTFVNCLVFTGDAGTVEAIQEKAAAAPSASKIEVGGEDLVDKIAAGQVNVDQFQRGLGTSDMQSLLTKRLARVLGPRGLMPNAKTGTLLDSPAMLLSALETQMAGTIIQYRTDREGIVHVRVGRASFGKRRLLDNVGAIAREIFRAKPDAYGKGKKSSKNAKYLLGAALTSTQGKGYKVDVRTLDPSSPFFMNWIEGEEEEEIGETEDGSEGSAAAKEAA